MIHQDIHYTKSLKISPKNHEAHGGYSVIKVTAKLEDGTEVTTIYYMTTPFNEDVITVEPVTGTFPVVSAPDSDPDPADEDPRFK